MHLFSFGCSLVWGTDLSDHQEQGPWQHGSKLTWPALLARKYDLKYASRAKGGSGNLCILDRVMQQACLFPDSVFVIQWTYTDRFDYSTPGGRHFNGSLNDYLTLRPTTDNELEKFYFTNLHSEYRDKLTGLIYIKTAIDFLTSQNVPFLMTCLDDILLCERWHATPAVLKLQEYVRPHINSFQGKNFLEWSRTMGFPISDNCHPLEEAHSAAAELMVPVIDAILRKA